MHTDIATPATEAPAKRYADNGREIAGPNAEQQRILALEVGNRFLAARNAALTRQLATLPAYLDELANQAGVFIGVATQAAITQRAHELRALIAAEHHQVQDA